MKNKILELHNFLSFKSIQTILFVVSLFFLVQQVKAECATSCQGEVNKTVNCGVRKAQECLVLNCNLTRTLWYRNLDKFYVGSYLNNMDSLNYVVNIDDKELDYLEIYKLRYLDAGNNSFRAEKLSNDNKTVIGSCSFSIYIYGKWFKITKFYFLEALIE